MRPCCMLASSPGRAAGGPGQQHAAADASQCDPHGGRTPGAEPGRSLHLLLQRRAGRPPRGRLQHQRPRRQLRPPVSLGQREQ